MGQEDKKWEKGTSIEFDTKKQAQERSKLLKETEGFRNVKISDRTTNGKFRVKFEFDETILI